jgi:putative ATPase
VIQREFCIAEAILLSLFHEIERKNKEAHRPLADRMRPRTLDEFVGQQDFLGPGRLLRRMIEARRVTSLLFYGPPGTGKTTLARLIAEHVDACFVSLNAADSSIKEVRQVIDEAKERAEGDGRQTLLFLDEIHHFNRTQQDILLPHVENGTLVLIGATTQNPFFSINAPLVSRSQIFGFQSHSPEDVKQLLQRAIKDKARGFGQRVIDITDDALEHWSRLCEGDARRALTALDIAVRSMPAEGPIRIDRSVAEDSIQRKAVVYDRTGDEHYDVASAFIKSMRGSDPDAAIYWLARMLEAGEEARFIARRLVIFASEDIGCADPMALVVAQSAAAAVEMVGLPEGQLNLAQAVIHLATAPKSNASAKAIWTAREDVQKKRTQPVPKHLRDRHYPGAKQLGHGEGYVYPHDHAEGTLDQQYLTIPTRFYEPTQQGHEREIAERLALFRQAREADDPSPPAADSL